VQGLELSAFSKSRLAETEKELREESAAVSALIGG